LQKFFFTFLDEWNFLLKKICFVNFGVRRVCQRSSVVFFNFVVAEFWTTQQNMHRLLTLQNFSEIIFSEDIGINFSQKKVLMSFIKKNEEAKKIIFFFEWATLKSWSVLCCCRLEKKQKKTLGF
jgi:hypothetical protein